MSTRFRVSYARTREKELQMKNLRSAVGTMGVIAAFSSAAMFLVKCSGDDNTDGGTDGATDVTTDSVKPDNFVPDGGGPDVTPDVVTESAVAVFRSNVANAFCTRYQTCCGTLDAGAFDLNACLQAASQSAWAGSNNDLTSAEVIQRGHAQLNTTAAQSCLAGLATLSCPTATNSEVNTLTDNCYGAVSGNLTAGGDCVSSVECQATEFCKFAGVDAGKSEAGTVQGQCATLVAQGQLCGQAPPYGDPTFASGECAYRGWHPPAAFCDYDSFPDAGGYTCQPLRANAAPCFNDVECASGMCGTLFQDCINTACTCATSRDYTGVCTVFKIKDAGPG